jgi:chromate reductase
MITIISGSNRKNNLTMHFASYVYKYLQDISDVKINFIDLSKIEGLIINEGMYDKGSQLSIIKRLQDDYIIPAEKFWFFVPEYNGSYPGVVKVILDAMSVREHRQSFGEKKACITGIASGRAGNLRGMDHLADVLNHLGMYVHPNKNPISSVYQFIDKEKGLIGEAVTSGLERQALELLKF